MAWRNCQGIFEGYELLQLTQSGLAKIGDPNAGFIDDDFELSTGDSITAYRYPTEPWRIIIHDGIIGWMIDNSGRYEYYNNVLYPAPDVYDWVKRSKADYGDSFTFKLVMCVDSSNQVAMLGTRTDFGDFTYFTNSVFYADALNYLAHSSITSNGGGATHIAKVTGQLKDLSSNLSDILMVSGGGGGGYLVGENAYNGADAGGISGSGDNSADQSTGNAFGQGESGTNVSGGGSGLYGGYKGTSSKSGGAGSGYIGNALLSNKKMVGYNVPTSSAEGTKTESVNVFDSNYVANKPKAGNGHVRIKYLSDGIIRFKNAIVFPNDNYDVKGKNTENIYTIGQLKQTFSGNNTWFLIWDTNGYIALQFNASSSWNMKLASGKYIVEGDEREDWLWGMNNVADPLYPCYLNGSYIGQSWSLESKTIGNDTYRNDCYTGGTEEHPCIIVSTIVGLEVYKDGVKVMVR